MKILEGIIAAITIVIKMGIELIKGIIEFIK